MRSLACWIAFGLLLTGCLHAQDLGLDPDLDPESPVGLFEELEGTASFPPFEVTGPEVAPREEALEETLASLEAWLDQALISYQRIYTLGESMQAEAGGELRDQVVRFWKKERFEQARAAALELQDALTRAEAETHAALQGILRQALALPATSPRALVAYARLARAHSLRNDLVALGTARSLDYDTALPFDEKDFHILDPRLFQRRDLPRFEDLGVPAEVAPADPTRLVGAEAAAPPRLRTFDPTELVGAVEASLEGAGRRADTVSQAWRALVSRAERQEEIRSVKVRVGLRDPSPLERVVMGPIPGLVGAPIPVPVVTRGLPTGTRLVFDDLDDYRLGQRHAAEVLRHLLWMKASRVEAAHLLRRMRPMAASTAGERLAGQEARLDEHLLKHWMNASSVELEVDGVFTHERRYRIFGAPMANPVMPSSPDTVAGRVGAGGGLFGSD